MRQWHIDHEIKLVEIWFLGNAFAYVGAKYGHVVSWNGLFSLKNKKTNCTHKEV